jgi:hypothetical protein
MLSGLSYAGVPVHLQCLLCCFFQTGLVTEQGISGAVACELTLQSSIYLYGMVVTLSESRENLASNGTQKGMWGCGVDVEKTVNATHYLVYL